MSIVKHPSELMSLDVFKEPGKRTTAFQAMVYGACLGAMMNAKVLYPFIEDARAGIVLFTEWSEFYPQAFRRLMREGKRVRPTQFETIIHNSATGFVAIRFGLRGPQLTLVAGNIEDVATLQLERGRARYMLVCETGALWAKCSLWEAVE